MDGTLGPKNRENGAHTSDVDIAVDLFRKGCACPQAIVGAYGPRYGLSEDQALRVAAGFGGGMRMAETCGAVTGAFMVLGLAHCDAGCRTAKGRKVVSGAVSTFAGRFSQRLCGRARPIDPRLGCP